MKKDWLKDIHDRMADYEVDEPQGLWDDICSAEAKAGIGYKGAKKRTLMPWIRGISATAACLLVMWHLFSEYSHDQQQAISRVEAEDMQRKAPHKENIVPVKAEESRTYAHAVKNHGHRNDDSAQYDDNTYNEPTVTSESSVSLPEPPKETVAEERRSARNTQPEDRQKDNKQQTIRQTDNEVKASHSLKIGVSTSGGTGSANRHLFQGGYMTAGVALSESVWADSPMLGIMDMNRGVETERKVAHHSPVRTGVSVSYQINDRWSIGSGLSYAYVSSNIREGSVSNYVSEDQSLNYIGIPIAVTYKALSWRNIDVYLSPDVLAEQCVYGKTDKKYIINDKVQEDKKDEIRSHPLQMSLGATVGAQYNINSLLSVYAEPGCRYYFDDRSSLETIFKENTFDFNLNLGVRFTIGK